MNIIWGNKVAQNVMFWAFLASNMAKEYTDGSQMSHRRHTMVDGIKFLNQLSATSFSQ